MPEVRSLRELFHQVSRMLPPEQELITVGPDTTCAEALATMRARGFSQLPVATSREVLGLFSYRSFSLGLTKLPSKIKDHLSLPVVDFLEATPFVAFNRGIDTLIDDFAFNDAVLVGGEGRVVGIVTTTDLLLYFYSVANAYVLLQEIETAIRELVRSALNPPAVESFLKRILENHYRAQGRSCPTTLEELTLSDFVNILRFRGEWERFEPAFGRNQDLVVVRIEQVPALRNDVFHFRREITVAEYEVLRDCRDWLWKRVRVVDPREAGHHS
jgi:CBS domain-containing protein